MKIKTSVLILILAILIILVEINQLPNTSYASTIDLEQLTQKKIEEIKNTENTDITGRNGQIYYVSQNGDDSNDGLTEANAWKTLSKINDAFNKKIISDGDTILLKRGDEFRGNINVTACDILIGAYGDESSPKPQILVSPYNGAIEGEWQEVQKNIWKYTVNGQNPFTNDVGVIWCFSNNSNLKNKMPNISGSFEYAQKIINNKNTDDSEIDLTEVLKNDLEFYQFGHPSAQNATGGDIYIYSTSNPKDRFDDIEFNISKNGIRFNTYTNLHVDNIAVKYAGNHGIGGGTVANLKVTNCEIGFIGGAMQYYKEDGTPVRFGNAIEIYGSVTDSKGYTVEDGFVADNNYIYQIYDAGLTFQITTENSSIIEKVVFSNNVIEYCNYDIEYWNTSNSLDKTVQENTYINNYTINNNIMRYAGYGVCATRQDKGKSCIIKTWEHNSKYDNRVIGEYKIINNIFDSPAEQMVYICTTDEKYLPTIEKNNFYSSKDIAFGYYYIAPTKINYPFSKQKLDKYFPNNEFNYLEEDFENNIFTGTSGETNWNLNIKNGTLTINGEGQMADYTAESLPEWYEYRNFINKIIIGKDVTKLGKYAFYKLPYVEELEIDAISLENLSRVGNNDGDNFTFYQTGKEWIGINLKFGEEVTRVPAQLFWPAITANEAPNIINIKFEGTKTKEIGDHAFLNIHAERIWVPSGVEKIGTLAFSGASAKTIYLPETVNVLGSWAFARCEQAEKIALSPNIHKIGEKTFNRTKSLKQLVIPGDVIYNNSNYTDLFSTESDTIVYGNETVKTLVEDYSTATGTNNIKYADLSLYPNLLNEIYTEAIIENDKIGVQFNNKNLYNAVINEIAQDYIYTKDDNTNTIVIGKEEIKKIKELELDGKDLSDLSGLDKFTELEKLVLNNNQITNISVLYSLSNLKYLDLAHNCVTNINGINNMSNLTYLNLYDNIVRDLSSLENMNNLQYLNLGDNNEVNVSEITNLESIGTLNNIKYFDFSRNNSKEIINYITNMQNVEFLNLQGNNIENIENISNLTNIKELYLNSNKITNISPILNITNIETLYLNSNAISSLEGLVENDELVLKKLKKLHIYNLKNLNKNANEISYLKELSKSKKIELGYEIIYDSVEPHIDENGIKYITYEDFGARCDGIYDDMISIKDAHRYANSKGYEVKATERKNIPYIQLLYRNNCIKYKYRLAKCNIYNT